MNKSFIKFSKALLLLSIALASSCGDKMANGLDDLSNAQTLSLKDSIVLENMDILNPHYIYYKDSFLIFNSLQGKKEIQLLNLSSGDVTEYRVIGQGRNEMQYYHTVNSTCGDMYLFADNRMGKVYGVNLDSLKVNSDINYDLIYSLPIAEGNHFYRFMDLPQFTVCVGMLKDGRFGIFEKETSTYCEQMEYPENEDIYSLGYMHKGALFSRTMMASDETGKQMVAACFGLIDFYSVSDDGQLTLRKSNHYHFPQFEIGTYGPAISFEKKEKVGMTGLCADENYVYALYSTRTFEDYGERAYNAPYLLVWNWSGELAKIYNLPVALYGFAISGNTVYGLSREESPIVYVFELDEN